VQSVLSNNSFNQVDRILKNPDLPSFDATYKSSNVGDGITRSSTSSSLASISRVPSNPDGLPEKKGDTKTTGGDGKVGEKSGDGRPSERLERRRQEKRASAVLVFFLGGITYPEISCFRLLHDQNKLGIKEDSNTKLLLGATSIISGKTLVQSLVDQYALTA